MDDGSRTGLSFGFCVVVALISACSRQPSEKDVVDSMVSWIGTADVASQAWLNHTTFDHYTEQTLLLAAEKLNDQAAQLSSSVPSHSAGLDRAASNAAHSMTLMAKLIAANDAPDVQHQLDSLRVSKKTVLAISDSLDKVQ